MSNNKSKAVILICWWQCIFTNVSAGTLDQFEKDSTEKSQSSSQKHQHSNNNSDDSDDDISSGLFEFLFRVTFAIIVDAITLGGQQSDFRVTGEAQEDVDFAIDPRELGEPIIPIFRFDGGYQYVSSDIHAFDARFESGYGRFGAMFRNTTFFESNPHDSLRYTQFALLYRMSFGSRFELDLGIGQHELSGNENTSGSFFTMPMYMRVTDQFMVQYRPVWGEFNLTDFDDDDFAFVYTRERVSYLLGYRKVYNPSSSLDGIYFGVSYHY